MKLILKDAVLTEIENRIRACGNCYILDELASLHRTFDSLEVTEVDLDKEIKEEYLKRRCYGGRDNMLVILNEPQFNEIAKHFFELGVNASNPLTWEDIDWIVGEAVCRVTEDSEAEQICKEVLERFTAQKG